MSEELKGGIEAGESSEAVEQDIDPELVDDRDVEEEENDVIELPDYDPTQFEEPDDEYEHVEDGDE